MKQSATPIDVREFALQRQSAARAVIGKRRVMTRYVAPAALLLAFAALLAWALRDVLLPARDVTVIPVQTTRGAAQVAGTPLFRAAGWVEPRPTPLRVAALASGVVERLLVVEDQAVKAGEPVAQLVARDAELALAAEESALRLREAEQAEAEANFAAAQVNFDQPLQSQAALAEAAALLAETRTELTNLPFELRRAEARARLADGELKAKAAAGDVVSGIVRQRAETEAAAAAALVEELRERRESLEQQVAALEARRAALAEQLSLKREEARALAEAKARVAAAAARVEQERVAVDQAKLTLERMTVRAPFDGRVLRLAASPGTRLMEGPGPQEEFDGSTVVTMYQPGSLQVRVDVRFEDLPRVVRGQQALIESPALAAPLAGRVLFLSSLANVQKNTLAVKVAIDSPPAVMKPEMLVQVTFLAPRAEEGSEPAEELRLFVPRGLVQQDEAGSFVWIADQQAGAAQAARVTTGARTQDSVEIVQGLTPASRLIADPPADLRPGERIRVTGEEGRGE